MIDVVIFFFVLGIFARLVKSDLRLPEALYETLSIYLLLAIGLKGGIEISKEPIDAYALQVAVAVGMSFAIPLLLFPLLRLTGFAAVDSASIAAHFGSVSVVTFAVVTSALTRAGLPYEAHAPLWVAVMEAPGLISGVLLARLFSKDSGGRSGGAWRDLAHDVLLGKSVVLLAGGLAIGAIAGVEGTAQIRAVFIDPFKGVLALFLLELGLVTGGRLAEVRRFGGRALLVGVALPPLLALIGAFAGSAIGLSVGGTAILATLAASASYIAAPTAMRIAIPEANAGLSITIALGITFPFNVVIGIPLYIRWAQAMG